VICQCGTELAPALTACPVCQRLVHADELKHLIAAATDAARRGDVTEELASLRQALDLLPPESSQAARIAARVGALSDFATGAASPAPITAGSFGGPGAPGAPGMAGAPGASGTPGTAATGRPEGKRWGARGALLTGITFVLTKAKLLLLGFTKLGTVLTMLLTVAVYWRLFGWWFAVLFVLSIYVHEMGHVAALRRFGMQATAPMFIPGLGALIRLRQHPVSAREDARIGLAGPLWGLGAALFAYGGFLLGWGPLWAAVARFGAWVNLFNLLPFWQLDGGRAFHSLSRWQRWTVVAVLAGLWAITREGLLILLGIGAVAQALRRDAPAADDNPILVEYALLATVLAFLSQLAVPGAAGP
jgi:Zn-dependent protease